MMTVKEIDCVFENLVNSDVIPFISPLDLNKSM